ncbi:DUF4003 family protein [Bacillus sp. KH172YL63]|uniref:DUF4003 family protein n=1 Tax=Bacillus sp. KH172YL63 TaxID=2709784 RepID=UPI0013E51DA1|nr:DUF4003 family protein [Bacillus sp. KH172YL63]BCB02674.1 hypothetical protein KH172YL63_08070 [Bacillus sp. KH172YL63]
MNHKVDQYKDIYGQLKKSLRWKVADSRSIMMVASLYVTSQRPFHLDRFLEISDYIKSEVGTFSTLKHDLRYTIAAMLDIRYDDPHTKFHDFHAVYDSLIDAGFSRGAFSYIGAMTMLSEDAPTPLAEHGMNVYKKMREKHFFLTGHSDYPFALLLAQREEDHESLIETIEDFYTQLHAAGFRKGNDLQSMSHILSLHNGTNPDELVSRCARLFDLFKKEGIKTKAMFYPHIALLSYVDVNPGLVTEVKALWDELNSEKLFKWQKDLNGMMAVTFLMSDKIEHTDLLQAKLSTAIETLIQAQQATMIATVSAVSASTTGGDA